VKNFDNLNDDLWGPSINGVTLLMEIFVTIWHKSANKRKWVKNIKIYLTSFMETPLEEID